MYWVLIETGSNQSYIFGTSKQRLQVAASAMIWDLGNHWIGKAANAAITEWNAGHGSSFGFIDRTAEIKTHIDGGTLGSVVSHIVKASGKAYLLVPERDLGVDIVRRITRRSIESGADIDVWGYVPADPIDEDLGNAAEVLRAGTVALSQQRYRRVPPLVRHPALPFHRRCAYTDLPATTEGKETESDNTEPRSARAAFLFERSTDARSRMLMPLRGLDAVVGWDDLGTAWDESRWIGVLHADGNGVGKIFTHLAEVSSGTDFVLRQAELSRSLEDITWEALRRTVESVGRRASVLPIIAGGDDVVTVVDGAIALDFADALAANFTDVARGPMGVAFRKVFDEIKRSPAVDAQVDGANLATELSLAVGLALIKPKHPFHHAVEVAESLTSLAKTHSRRKEGSVAIHVLYESALRSLTDLRAENAVGGGCFLARPLLVDGIGVGTVAELREMMQTISGTGVSTGAVQTLREAVTVAVDRRDAAHRLDAARKQSDYILGDVPMPDILTTIAIDTDGGANESLFTAQSPSTLITALELLDAAERGTWMREETA